MSILKKATLVLAGVATLAATAPAMADRGYGRHDDHTGAIVAGALVLGTIAAIAASSHHDHDRYYNNGYYGYGNDYPSYGYAYPSYGYGYRGGGYEHRAYGYDNHGYRGGERGGERGHR